MLLPHFIGIGGHRCGSSWLWKHIGLHTEIWTPTAKELHFFDRKLTSGFGRVINEKVFVTKLYYSRYFLKSGFHLHKVRGEFTPAYGVMSEEKVHFCSLVAPNAKLLIIMRNPVDALWSHIRKDYEDNVGKSPQSASIDELIAFSRLDSVHSRRDYAAILEKWLRYYPQEQIRCLFFEECMKDPVHFLNEVYRFLGVKECAGDLGAEVFRQKINARPYSEMPEVLREFAVEEYKDINYGVERIVGRGTPWRELA